MKQLLVAEMNRALELIEKIEIGKEEYKIRKEENDRKIAEHKQKGLPYYHYYVADTTYKDVAELKKMLKMIRLHSVIFEKEIKHNDL